MEQMQEKIARYMASMENTSRPTSPTTTPTHTPSYNNVNINCLALRHRDAESDSDVSEESSSSSCELGDDPDTGLSRVDSFSGNNNRPSRVHSLLLGNICSQNALHNVNVNTTAVTHLSRQDGNRHRDRTRHETLNRQSSSSNIPDGSNRQCSSSSSSGNRPEDFNRLFLMNRRASQGYHPEKNSREGSSSQHLWQNQHHSRRRHSSSSSSRQHHPQQQQTVTPQCGDQDHPCHRRRRHRSGSVSSTAKQSSSIIRRHQRRPEQAEVAETETQQGLAEHEEGGGSESPRRCERRHSVSRHHLSQKKQQQQQQSIDNDHVSVLHHQPSWRQRRSSGTVYPKTIPDDPAKDIPEGGDRHECEPQTSAARSPKRYVYPDLREEQDEHHPLHAQPLKTQTPGRRRSQMPRDSPQHQAWLDTYPRTRLHTVSGAGSDLRTSLHHAMSPMHVSPTCRGRGMSLKKAKKKLTVDVTGESPFRPRTCSLPARNPYCRPGPYPHHLSPPPYGQGVEFYTLRSFQTTRKGQLVKRGDSLKSRSSNSVRSSGSGSVTELTLPSSPSASVSPGGGGGGGESEGPGFPTHALTPAYSVLIVGGEGVGKSSLTRQFSTSDYLGPFDPNAEASGVASIDGSTSAGTVVLEASISG
ncbi:hypothetical protein ACOMHN_054244 [Nucella lapillus]